MDPRFDLQPTLEAPGLTLRPLRDDDFEALFAVSSDRQIWAVHPAHDRWRPDVFRRFFADAMASGGALVAIDPASGAIIGHSRYDFGRAGPGEIEIGWTFLARDRWGGETNRRMKHAMLTHAFRFLERVIFVVGENNGRSRRAMEKIGGRLTDRIVETPMAGVNARHLVYAIDRETFTTGPLC